MRLFISFLFISKLLLSQNVILRDVNIIPINHDITIKGCSVYLRDGKIERITPYPLKKEPNKRVRSEITKGYTIINCEGRYLMPGLADMHAHFPDKDDLIKLQEYLKLNLAAGVTELRSMRGQFKQLALRDSVNKGLKKLSPEIFVSYVFPTKDTLLTKDSIEKIVHYAVDKKYDFIKYLGGINQTNMNYLIESCKQNSISLAGHSYDRSIDRSVDMGFASIEHYQSLLTSYNKDSLNFKKLLESMKQKRVAFCPTLSFYYVYSFGFTESELMNRNGMNYLSSTVKKEWLKEYNEVLTSTKEKLKTDFEPKYIDVYKKQFAIFNKILKMAIDAGVLVLLSPDDGIFNVPGFGMFEEMKLYKNAGLSNYQILKCATLNAAKFFNQEKNWGSVEIGKKANLVLLNNNPLENIDALKQVDAIILNGKYYSQKDLVKENK
jgi:hypothetical protein